MKIIVAYSGGKDSQACLIWAAKKFQVENIEAVFCDTGWEHELTYKHVEDTTKQMGIKLVRLQSKKFSGFIDLAKKKKRFPSTKARFCTEELKTKPMIDYLLSQTDDLLIIQGIRKDESTNRSKMIQHCNFFKYYFRHYKINKKGKPVYHTYRKKDVIAWKEKYADEILRPCFEWTAIQTIEYIVNNGYEPNPLYKMGMSRVGCMPCVMCRHQEIKNIADNIPEIISNIQEAEKITGRTFFPPKYIPARFCKQTDSKTGKKIPFIDDVVNYVTDDKNQINLLPVIEGESDRCMSVYNLCDQS